MGVLRSGYFWQFGSIASLAIETIGGEILVAFWPKHGLRSDLRVANLIFFSWGSMPPDSPAYSHLSAHNSHTKSAGSSPASSPLYNKRLEMWPHYLSTVA